MNLNYDPDDEWEEDEDQDEMETDLDVQFPEYSQASRDAARFIGLPFPYVPGDPGL